MPRKAADKPATKKTSIRKKKTDVVAEAVADVTPVVEVTASEAPVKPAPKKRGRKPKATEETVADAPVKKTRGRKKADAPAEVTTDAPKKRGRKKTAVEEVAAPVVEAATVIEASIAEAPAVEAPAPEVPAKKTRKPRAKKASAKPTDDTPKKRGRKPKETGPVLTTTLQIGDREFDISGIAEKAYKEYKSVHKRKVVTDFHIYVKPEEGAAYFTINGEGSDDFKIDLT